MVRAMRLADIPDITCNVHQLQICVRHMLDYDEDVKEFDRKMQKFAHILTTLKSHRVNSIKYKMEQYILYDRGMIQIQDSLCLYASKHNIPQISPQEWQQLKN
ncbi:hypothetical protein EVAR_98121_1 [Eumeta japonica]|uniref:Uncharacterized protein n=1 Tax=Eumeta variegata TaxID=151549 RepID=A0A4C2AB20_EUMVA|nr:hypothetical protein EVAR_98121_1 [Eumeta japonica]